MFGFFSKRDKRINKKIPAFYAEILTQKEYELILGYAIESCKQFGELISASEGTIKIKALDNQDNELLFHLDNLVRRCKNEANEDWKTIVENHFSKLVINPQKEKYIFKDFDFAEPLIKFLVRTYNTFDQIEAFVFQSHIPDTYSFLVLDYDDMFHFVRKDEIKEWGKTEAELFEIAFDNIAKEDIDIKEVLWLDQFEIFTFFSHNFSPSFVVDLEANGPFAIGKYGSVVTIPTKGSAMVHPINGNTVMSFISTFDETLQKFFSEDEVPVSDRYFWFYEGQFKLFNEREENGKTLISMPDELEKLLHASL